MPLPACLQVVQDFESVEAMVLVQTADVMRSCSVLLRLYFGLHERKLPFLCLQIEGKGFTFDRALILLGTLAHSLPAASIKELQSFLQLYDSSIEQMAAALADQLFSLIAINLDPFGSELHRSAVTQETPWEWNVPLVVILHEIVLPHVAVLTIKMMFCTGACGSDQAKAWQCDAALQIYKS